MSKKFDKLLEASTDSTLLEPNWDAIIGCFDSVRSGEVPAKAALTSIQKRLNHENPHVVYYALLVLDACVKNCGPKFHNEVATREFMEEFKNLAFENKYDKVKDKTLEMLQCWAMAFVNKPEYKIVVDTHNLLKLAGVDFPSVKEADAMFLAQVAPDWADGPECYRCRTEFGLLNRKHHCRACGQIFCDRCSSREMALPQFGIEKEVRVCDACYEKGAARVNASNPSVQTKTIKLEEVSAAEKERLLREKEEEDLAKALQLSKIEAETKEKKEKSLYSMFNGDSNSYYPQDQASEIGGYKGTASTIPESPSEQSIADDPLARYLNRDYWQQKKAGAQAKVEEWTMINNTASAPVPSDAASVITTVADESFAPVATADPVLEAKVADIDAQAEETIKWGQQLKEQVGIMENRIRSNVARGRAVVNDSAIQGLFLRLTEYHAQVLNRMGKLDEERAFYEGLQDQLAHIVDARSAVNQLRDENVQRRRAQLEAEQRMRQAQMKQTLDMMRMKKHAMLMEQRDVALQRFQQQEQEMQARRQAQPMYGGYGQPMPPSYGVQQPMYGMPPYYQQQQQPQYQPVPQQPSHYAPAPGANMPPQPVQGYPQQQQQHVPTSHNQPAVTTAAQPPTSYPGYPPMGQEPHAVSSQPSIEQQPPQQHQQYGYAPQVANSGYGYVPAPAAVAPAPAPVAMPPPAAAAPVPEAPLISFD